MIAPQMGQVKSSDQLQEEHSQIIQPILLEENQGKGHAIRCAILAASGDIAIIQDADLEYDPADYDIVLASNHCWRS
jgi:glycosyltransferase involved in cell wall biosynthesis